jgi:superfamily II DNA/RNA helicase
VRTRTLKLFKEQENAALVATDVAARDIHVDGISLVVHVDAQQITKIIYTALVAQHVLAKLVE